MQCMNHDCQSMKTSVYETRATPAIVYRRRRCLACGWMFVSAEVVAPDQKMPVDIRQQRKQEAA
jgi:transcriptional regulator NrdR family protein